MGRPRGVRALSRGLLRRGVRTGVRPPDCRRRSHGQPPRGGGGPALGAVVRGCGLGRARGDNRRTGQRAARGETRAVQQTPGCGRAPRGAAHRERELQVLAARARARRAAAGVHHDRQRAAQRRRGGVLPGVRQPARAVRGGGSRPGAREPGADAAARGGGEAHPRRDLHRAGGARSRTARGTRRGRWPVGPGRHARGGARHPA
mmetsp:Transcript_12507/g.52623  ORF Transcript_12507/g.52623 Transcript_12507/m.52623 type:complete len:204 (-) Transcript_12507:2362-2973(-)